MARSRLTLFLASLLLLIGCEEEQANWADLQDLQPIQATLEPVTRIRPGEAALAVRDDGGLYFAPRRDGEQDEVYLLAGRAAPKETGLDVAAALRVAGVTEGKGHFLSMLDTPAGLLYHFAGGNDVQSADHLGLFVPSAGRHEILLDAATLSNLSGLGGTLVLADSQLAANDRQAFFLLRTPGDAVVLTFNLNRLATQGQRLQVEKEPLPLVATFGQLDLRDNDLRISAAGPPDQLLATDPNGEVFLARFSERRAELALDHEVPGPIPEVVPARSGDQSGLLMYVPPLPLEARREGDPADLLRPWAILFDRSNRELANLEVIGGVVEPDSFFPTRAYPLGDNAVILHDPSLGLVAKLTLPD